MDNDLNTDGMKFLGWANGWSMEFGHDHPDYTACVGKRHRIEYHDTLKKSVEVAICRQCGHYYYIDSSD